MNFENHNYIIAYKIYYNIYNVFDIIILKLQFNHWSCKYFKNNISFLAFSLLLFLKIFLEDKIIV